MVLFEQLFVTDKLQWVVSYMLFFDATKAKIDKNN